MNLHLWVRTITMNNSSGGWSNSVRMHFVRVFVVFVVSWTETVMYVPAENTKSYSGTNSRLLRSPLLSTPGQVLTVVNNVSLHLPHNPRWTASHFMLPTWTWTTPVPDQESPDCVKCFILFFRERIQLKKRSSVMMQTNRGAKLSSLYHQGGFLVLIYTEYLK